ncbi:MAG: hypothetical protein P4N60_08645 [Verrucomicrobiae bacterium]|nr:hypothetical protein [Verrucomicrobiae bacterium]
MSKGQLGHDKANLLGSLLVTQFQLGAMARSTRPESERRDFYLFIDEFQNFSTDAFASILAEARKYRLALTLSHQYFVFNVAQCEGLKNVPEGDTNSFAVTEAAEIVAGMPQQPAIKLGMKAAYYSPSSDTVGMPVPRASLGWREASGCCCLLMWRGSACFVGD